ncbi:MAG: NADPH-dependent 7-cyano-7-deazaguanine reductase QueF [Janthinobacterium lividum]
MTESAPPDKAHSPLGKTSEYIERYAPELLFPIARLDARLAIGIGAADRPAARLPFFGMDIWNAYELSWLNQRGKPQVAIATILVPADSPAIIESKSFKLYLGSFAQTPFESHDAVRATISADASAACGASVRVRLLTAAEFGMLQMEELEGLSLDRLDLDTDIYEPDASLLTARFDEAPVDETLVSNLLKTNCPVTGQPDWGSLQIRYGGPPIDQAGLLRYIISFRRHSGFHEQCVERIFVDLMRECRCERLAVYARYTRRGGLDINPFRTNFNMALPDNLRNARQ